ncbi:MAG TPA: phosphatase PAP2 family protein [Opitutaceae bacterium]|nr:phosphatase PAP2 family protein [Opitutaceae bacterium]
MHRLIRIGTLVACLLTAPLFAVPSFHYLPSEGIELKVLLGNPPADGSTETKREIEIMLREQARRTSADMIRTKSEIAFSSAAFTDILGAEFTLANLPLTFALLRNVEDDARSASEEAKLIWNRPRPPLQDSRVTPAVDLPKTGSYPSGHATRGHLYAMILGELFPEKRAALLSRGWLVGWDRVMGGVHFPSDIAAGFKLGDALATQMIASATFQTELLKARAECEHFYSRGGGSPKTNKIRSWPSAY